MSKTMNVKKKKGERRQRRKGQKARQIKRQRLKKTSALPTGA